MDRRESIYFDATLKLSDEAVKRHMATGRWKEVICHKNLCGWKCMYLQSKYADGVGMAIWGVKRETEEEEEEEGRTRLRRRKRRRRKCIWERIWSEIKSWVTGTEKDEEEEKEKEKKEEEEQEDEKEEEEKEEKEEEEKDKMKEKEKLEEEVGDQVEGEVIKGSPNRVLVQTQLVQCWDKLRGEKWSTTIKCDQRRSREP